MKILNRRAKFDFTLIQKYEAGVVLKGEDLRLLKSGKVTLKGAYAKIINGEVFLLTTGLPTRKLLLHKKEILVIETKIKAKKLTIVPTKLYTKGRLVKAELALAKAKRKFEKRDSIKKKDIKREVEKELKGRS